MGSPNSKEVWDLLTLLSDKGYDINIETNGSIPLKGYDELRPNVWFTMDWKCPSSGMVDKMFSDNLSLLTEDDVLKFVVGNEDDLQEMNYIITKFEPKAQIYVSPVFGEIELEEIANYILDNSLENVRLQVQLHKLVWDPEERGV